MKPSRSMLKIGELATGQDLELTLFEFSPEEISGPSVYIQANVHGAEVQGNAVIYQLMQALEQVELRGKVTLVPLANPLGINQKSGEFTLGRFDPITGVNWNREYLDHKLDIASWYQGHSHLGDVELIAHYRALLVERCHSRLHEPWGITTGHRLAVSLQQMGHEADIVLDLHTGPKSCKHLYCPEYDKDAAKVFSIPYTLLIPNEFGGAMDESIFCPWWQLSEYLSSQGRELEVPVSAFTLELGSQENIDLADALVDVEGILAYLSQRGVIGERIVPADMPRYACYLKDYKKYHAPLGGLVEYKAKVGQPLNAGEPLANILRVDRYGEKEAIVPLSLPVDCVPVLHFASASVYQGTELYKVMTKVFAL